MKKLIALLLAFLMLMLTACAVPGQPWFDFGKRPATETVPEELPAKPGADLTEQGIGKKPSSGKQEEEPEEEFEEPVSIDVLWTALQAAGLPEMTVLDETEQFQRCGIDADQVSQSIVAVCADSSKMDELWLIEAKTADAAKEIVQLAESHLRRKSGECVSTAPEQYDMVEQAFLRREGRYVILLVSPLAETLRQLSEDMLCLPEQS